MFQQSGKLANKNGTELETFVQSMLDNKEYQFVERNKFLLATNGLQQKFYTKQMIICESIYSTSEKKHHLNADFVIYNSENKDKYIIIECKSQTSAGSVDEKYPYLNENIKTQYPYKTIVVLDAPAAKNGAKNGAKIWFKKQEKININLEHVFESFSEFRMWAMKNL